MIHKRRFRCKPCRKVFLEPVPGIAKYAKFTKRFEKGLSWASTKFSSLSDVQKNYRCSAGKCFKAAYGAMKTRLKANQYPCPKQMGIDEHSLKKPKYEATHYSTILVDHVNEKVYDLIDGRAKADLDQAFGKMYGKENVELFTLNPQNSITLISPKHLRCTATRASEPQHPLGLFRSLCINTFLFILLRYFERTYPQENG